MVRLTNQGKSEEGKMERNKYAVSGIKGWSVEERPREKLINLGSGGVSNAELLAIIIGSGSREASAVELARRVLEHFDHSLHKLEASGVAELRKIKGIGFASATKIVSAFMLGRRQIAEPTLKKFAILSSKDAWMVIQPYLSGLDHEEFWIALLNRANHLIKVMQVSKGSLAGTLVDIRKIYALVADYKASGIVLYHNHPSGAIKPSEQDRVLTKKIVDLSAVMEIKVLDHLIIGSGNFFSFADEGLL
jgi:DNA repair protein RadC